MTSPCVWFLFRCHGNSFWLLPPKIRSVFSVCVQVIHKTNDFLKATLTFTDNNSWCFHQSPELFECQFITENQTMSPVSSDSFTGTIVPKNWSQFSHLLPCCSCRCARSWQRCWSLNHMPRPEQCVSVTASLTLELWGFRAFLLTHRVIVLIKTLTSSLLRSSSSSQHSFQTHYLCQTTCNMMYSVTDKSNVGALCSVQSGGQRHLLVHHLEGLRKRDHTWEGKYIGCKK